MFQWFFLRSFNGISCVTKPVLLLTLNTNITLITETLRQRCRKLYADMQKSLETGDDSDLPDFQSDSDSDEDLNVSFFHHYLPIFRTNRFNTALLIDITQNTVSTMQKR